MAFRTPFRSITYNKAPKSFRRNVLIFYEDHDGTLGTPMALRHFPLEGHTFPSAPRKKTNVIFHGQKKNWQI